MPVMSEEEREKSQRIAEARLEKAMRKSIDTGRDAYGHWGFLSLQKMKFMFFEVFKLAKNEIHVFWGFLSLQKMKFMFFEVI